MRSIPLEGSEFCFFSRLPQIFLILANVISCRCDAGMSHEFLHFHNIYVFTDEASSKSSSQVMRRESAVQIFGFGD